MKPIKLKNIHNFNEQCLCYNCQIEIIDKSQKYCPNCNFILKPNDYIKWQRSCFIFLNLLCLMPILIAIIVIIFSF